MTRSVEWPAYYTENKYSNPGPLEFKFFLCNPVALFSICAKWVTRQLGLWVKLDCVSGYNLYLICFIQWIPNLFFFSNKFQISLYSWMKRKGRLFSTSLSDPSLTRGGTERTAANTKERNSSLAKTTVPKKERESRNKATNYIVRENVNFLIGDDIYFKCAMTAGNLSG